VGTTRSVTIAPYHHRNNPGLQHICVDIYVHSLGDLFQPALIVILLLDLMLSFLNLSSNPDPFLQLGQEPRFNGEFRQFGSFAQTDSRQPGS
jgi:hypothetical protein